MTVAVQVYQALQYLVSRENDPWHPFVITIGALHARTVANVIPNEATWFGTVRSLDPEVNQSLPERLERVVAGVCQATRARYTFEFVRRYPAMVNDETFTRQAIARVTALLGEPAVAHIPTPQLGGEGRPLSWGWGGSGTGRYSLRSPSAHAAAGGTWRSSPSACRC